MILAAAEKSNFQGFFSDPGCGYRSCKTGFIHEIQLSLKLQSIGLALLCVLSHTRFMDVGMFCILIYKVGIIMPTWGFAEIHSLGSASMHAIFNKEVFSFSLSQPTPRIRVYRV